MGSSPKEPASTRECEISFQIPGCDSSFKQDGVHRMRHELLHNPPPRIPAEPTLESTLPDPSDQNSDPKDDVFDYHCGFMKMALLLRNV